MRMKKTAPKLTALIFLFGAAVLLNCSSSPTVAGDVTETGNASVMGKVLDNDGSPAGGVIVRLIPSDSFPSPESGMSNLSVDTTDETGSYYFLFVKQGSYNIIAQDTLSGERASTRNIEVTSDSIQPPPAKLRQTGALLVRLPQTALTSGTIPGFLSARGTDVYLELVNAVIENRSVIMAGLPADTISALVYNPGDGSSVITLAENIAVPQNDTLHVSAVFDTGSLFIGIDDWGTAADITQYNIVSENRSLFDYRTAVLSVGEYRDWYERMPEGSYVSEHITMSDTIGMNTAFIWQGFMESSFDTVVSCVFDSLYMAEYFNHFDTALSQMTGHSPLLIIEPFTLGYITQQWNTVNPDVLDSTFVYVEASGADWLSGYDNSFRGMMHALIDRAYDVVPGIQTGLFLINWAMWTSDQSESFVYWSPQSEIDAKADLWETFFGELEILPRIDFLSIGKQGVDAGYAGAGYYWGEAEMQNWLYFSNLISQKFRLPLIGWYLPIGHTELPNTNESYEDTFAQYFFSNSSSFEQAGFRGMLFGRYEQEGTKLSDDGSTGDRGWFIEKLREWR